ncbi:META domain-containing protein [Lyngbya confervoides]|uniref:META domain-containing protein n=1 Tax=Lyngbya confervoides BDU141951 TaxID=1574623 RepID=A0ABD4T8Q0_9CYAN|nr:META domain-containing protein [Lyngbya confervoides]MCM1984971.1 META domain-containing protein [Lyngbya confervoides BDU141951]
MHQPSIRRSIALAASLGAVIVQGSLARVQSEPIWYNCLTREVFTPEKKAWCDRWQALQSATFIVPVGQETHPTYTTATLSYGRYKASHGSLFVELVNQKGWITFGDLTGNGRDDAAVILKVAHHALQSPAAIYLSTVLDVDGDLQVLTPIKLGDQDWGNGPLSIENQRLSIPVSTLTSGPNRQFKVQNFRMQEQSSGQMSAPASLETALWALTQYSNAAGEVVPVQATNEPPTIQFRAGQVRGVASCNRFFGTYTLEGRSLSLQLKGITKMACPGSVEAQEQAVLAALQQVRAYTMADGAMQLLDDSGNSVLTFTQVAAPPLINTPWQLMSYNNGQGAVVSAMSGVVVTAQFHDDGRLTGIAGCNHYMANYVSTENTLAIAPSVRTRKLCRQPDGVMEQESAYLKILETAETYRIEGERLILVNSAGATVAQLRAVDMNGTSP